MAGHIYNAGTASGVCISGAYAYLANAQDGLRIYDISNPSSPRNMGHTNITGSAVFSAVAVQGPYAYVTGHPGLMIFDVSDPSQPAMVSRSYETILGMGLCIAGNYAYIASGYTGIHVCDVSSPENPVPLGNLIVNLSAYSIALNGPYAYIAAKDGGMRIVNVSNPTNLTEVGSIRTASGYYLGIAINDHYAYVANSLQGLITYDIADFKHPIDLSPFPSSGATAVSLAGNYAYVGRAASGVTVYDISAPGTFETAYPVGQTKTNYGGTVNGIAISGNYAYVANGNDGLRIYSLGRPVPPKLTINIASNNMIQCTWPAPSAAFVLQESSNVDGPNWTTLTNGFQTVELQNRITVATPPSLAFYRLTSH